MPNCGEKGLQNHRLVGEMVVNHSSCDTVSYKSSNIVTESACIMLFREMSAVVVVNPATSSQMLGVSAFSL